MRDKCGKNHRDQDSADTLTNASARQDDGWTVVTREKSKAHLKTGTQKDLYIRMEEVQHTRNETIEILIANEDSCETAKA